MRIFNGIAYGIDRLIGSLQVFIHVDTLHFAQLQSGFHGQTSLCPYTDGKNHQLCLSLQARLELHLQPGRCFFKGFYRLLQVQFDTFLLQMTVYQSRHGEIYRSHHLVGHFHHGYLYPCMMQVLGHLQSDETTSYDDGFLHLMTLHVILDTVSIRHIPQSKDSFTINSGQRGTNRRSPRRKQQFVVSFGILLSV